MEECLFLFEIAWLAAAAALRHDQMAFPEGFAAERERQAARLESMARIVRAAEPDLELERLRREGDDDALMLYFRSRLSDEGL